LRLPKVVGDGLKVCLASIKLDIETLNFLFVCKILSCSCKKVFDEHIKICLKRAKDKFMASDSIVYYQKRLFCLPKLSVVDTERLFMLSDTLTFCSQKTSILSATIFVLV